jgi:hypothetical protein
MEYRKAGNFGVGVYGDGASIRLPLLDLAIDRVANRNGHPEEIPQDEQWTAEGYAWAQR